MPEGDANEWVEVRSFYSLVNLDQARMLLGTRGIPHRTLNEDTLRMRHHVVFAVGGAKLLVPRSQLGRAEECLGVPRASDEEVNYALRVHRSKLVFCLAGGVSIPVGLAAWFRMGDLRATLSVMFVAFLAFVLMVGPHLVPKAVLKRGSAAQRGKQK